VKGRNVWRMDGEHRGLNPGTHGHGSARTGKNPEAQILASRFQSVTTGTAFAPEDAFQFHRFNILSSLSVAACCIVGRT
jgi:hypothetical protein